MYQIGQLHLSGERFIKSNHTTLDKINNYTKDDR